jgi:hypothetical protein
MPSTYTLNNGIELIATGEQSGTWGDTTNVNLGLIDTALDGQVTITLFRRPDLLVRPMHCRSATARRRTAATAWLSLMTAAILARRPLCS